MLRRHCLSSTLLIALCLFAAAPERLSAQEDGLFASILTSEGSIRVALYPDEAPLAVSNFIGLAEGSQKAIDPSSGKLITNGFYDDTVIHRVVADSLIQAGSPTGNEADGPGYAFQDEFHPTRTFDSPFMLAMANSGPNSNGSQFFITAAPRPDLNNVHTVFGNVVEGSELVTSISNVATDQAERPLSPVSIESITIERIGSEAEAFQPDFDNLPQARLIEPKISRSGNTFELDLEFELRTDYRLYISRDLQSWQGERVAFVSETLPSKPFDMTGFITSDQQGFFRLAEVKYPVVIFPPEILSGKTLDSTITIFQDFPQNTWIRYAFTGESFAKASLKNGSTGDVTGYSYTLNSPTRATLVIPSSLASTFSLVQFVLSFASASTGTFSAVLPNANPAGTIMSGTFTLNDTPAEP